jgi:hypothetical protein
VSQLDTKSLTWTGLIPVEMSHLGFSYSGMIISNDNIFEMFYGLERTNKRPALYMRGEIETEYTNYKGISSTFFFGNQALNYKISPSQFYSRDLPVLGQFDFLLFMENDDLAMYNSSSFILLSTRSNSQLNTQVTIEDALPKPVIWLSLPKESPTVFSLEENLDEGLNYPVIIIITILVIFIISFTEPRIILGDDVGRLIQRGYFNQRSIFGMLRVSLIDSFVLIIISALGSTIITFLINYFNLLYIISSQIQVWDILFFSLAGGFIWVIGKLCSFYFQINN